MSTHILILNIKMFPRKIFRCCKGSIPWIVVFVGGIVFTLLTLYLGYPHLFVSHKTQTYATRDEMMFAEEKDLSNTLPPGKLEEIKSAYNKIFCDIKITKEMDLMKMKLPPFIERFKNPCWYEGETLLCLPYFYIVGADKCGTTDMFLKISKHPDYIKPSRKEPQWMLIERFRIDSSLAFYNKKYYSNLTNALSAETGQSNLISFKKRLRPAQIQTSRHIHAVSLGSQLFAISQKLINESHKFRPIRFISISADANVFNLQGPQFWHLLGANVGLDEPVETAADYIYHLNSKAKIMINVRNPIDKIWSQYLALSHTRKKSAALFHQIVVRGIELYKDCMKTRTVRSCMYDRNLVHLTMLNDEERRQKLEDCRSMSLDTVILRTGVFHVFIRDYLKVFPREQVLIQRLEDISVDKEGSLYKIYKFLDLDILPEYRMKEIANMTIANLRGPFNALRGDMFNSTRQLLYDFYKPFNEELAILMNDQKYNYGTSG